MATSIVLRPPLQSSAQEPYPPIDTRRPVRVVHPAYPTANGGNVLLSLVSTDGDERVHGVHFVFVRTACAIIANNRFDGWLSTSEDLSATRIQLGDNAILPAGTYYFHVPEQFEGQTARINTPSDFPTAPSSRPINVPSPTPPANSSRPYLYPIVPNFRSWSFPHGGVPSCWRNAVPAPQQGGVSVPTGTPASMVKIRDISCRLTNHGLVTEMAHILPTTEKDWFASNRMDNYRKSKSRAGQDVIDAESNLMLLRPDIHHLWDRMKYNIVPKPSKDGWVFTAHATDASQELNARYHNTILQPLHGISPEYLFARFAWDLFPEVRGFLQERQKRLLAVRQEDGSNVTVEFSSEECQHFCEDQGQSRSASTSKRRQAQQEAGTADTDDLSVDSAISGIDDNLHDTQHDSDSWEVVNGGDEQESVGQIQWRDPYGQERAKRYLAFETQVEADIWGTEHPMVWRGRKRTRR